MGKPIHSHEGLTAANQLVFPRTQLDKGVDSLDFDTLLDQEESIVDDLIVDFVLM